MYTKINMLFIYIINRYILYIYDIYIGVCDICADCATGAASKKALMTYRLHLVVLRGSFAAKNS